MATPSLLVQIGFDTSSQGGPFFLWGSGTVTDTQAAKDANPQSIFDNTTYRFGGTLNYDVTDRVRSVSITRGRSRELDRYQTGVANITFKNQDRAFDPFYTSSPYYPDIKPRRNVTISTIIVIIIDHYYSLWLLNYVYWWGRWLIQVYWLLRRL